MSGGASSSNSSSSPQLTPQQLISLYTQNLPNILNVTASQAPGVTNTLASAAAGANPIYTASGLNQLLNYAGGYQSAGNQLASNQAQSTADILNGSGANAAAAGANLINEYNPALSTDQTQAQNLVNSINLNGLSGGEQAAAERSLNQSNYATGNLGVDNATNAVANAMNFGNALNAKRTALSNALSTGSTVAGTSNTAFNPVTTATNSMSTGNNFGLGQFNPTQANSTTSTATNFGSSFGNQLTGIGSASRSNSSSGSAQGGVSCFLTTACCEYMGLPDDCEELTTLRKFRDEHVPKELVEEYYKVAPSIVEKIKDNTKELQAIYNTISDCCVLIHFGCYDNAIKMYKSMVNDLKERILK